MKTQRTHGANREASWQQIGLMPVGSYKARLEVWNPEQDNDTVLVTVEFRDASGHLVAMRVGSAALSDGDRAALQLAVSWYRDMWEAMHDPFGAYPECHPRH